MNREFLLNVFFLIAINLLIKPFYIFGIDRTVQNQVGTEAYGLYFALFGSALLFQIVNDFGIQNFNNRFISQNRQLVSKYLPNVLALKFVLSSGYLLLLFLWAWVARYDGLAWHLLFFLGLTQILASLVLYLRSNIAGLGLYRLDSMLSACDRLLLIGLMSWLLWGPLAGAFRIEWFVYAQTCTMGLTVLLAFWAVWRHAGGLRVRLRPAVGLMILRKSWPFALVVFLMTLYTRLDAIMLERLLVDGKEQAGIYASAYRLLDAGNMIGYLFAGLLLPMFSRQLKEGGAVETLAKLGFRLIMVGAIAASVAIYFNRMELSSWMYVDADAEWGQVLGVLMITFVAGSGSYIYGTLLTANGKLRAMNQIFALSILLNIGLNLALIFRYGALGAALATICTQFLVLFGQILIAQRYFNFEKTGLMMGRLLGYGAWMIAAGWGFSQLEWPWGWAFIAILGWGVVSALGLRVIHLSDFQEFLRKV